MVYTSKRKTPRVFFFNAPMFPCTVAKWAHEINGRSGNYNLNFPSDFSLQDSLYPYAILHHFVIVWSILLWYTLKCHRALQHHGLRIINHLQLWEMRVVNIALIPVYPEWHSLLFPQWAGIKRAYLHKLLWEFSIECIVFTINCSELWYRLYWNHLGLSLHYANLQL